MRARHPARQAREVERLGAHDRHDATALLAGVAPLAADDLGAQRRRRHDQDQVLDRVDRLGDLPPPVAAARHVLAVVPEGEALTRQLLAQGARERLAIAAGVGDEDPRVGGVSRHRRSFRASFMPNAARRQPDGHVASRWVQWLWVHGHQVPMRLPSDWPRRRGIVNAGILAALPSVPPAEGTFTSATRSSTAGPRAWSPAAPPSRPAAR